MSLWWWPALISSSDSFSCAMCNLNHAILMRWQQHNIIINKHLTYLSAYLTDLQRAINREQQQHLHHHHHMRAVSAIATSRLIYKSSLSLSRVAMMSTAPPSSKIIPIDVVSDTVWPWCYIGKRRLDSALADAKTRFPQLSFDVRWRPFEVC